MTPCPHRLQIQTSWTGGILTRKITFCRDKCLTKVVHTMELNVLSIKTPVRMTPLSSWSPPPDFMDGGHPDREDAILGEMSSWQKLFV